MRIYSSFLFALFIASLSLDGCKTSPPADAPSAIEAPAEPVEAQPAAPVEPSATAPAQDAGSATTASATDAATSPTPAQPAQEPAPSAN